MIDNTNGTIPYKEELITIQNLFGLDWLKKNQSENNSSDRKKIQDEVSQNWRKLIRESWIVKSWRPGYFPKQTEVVNLINLARAIDLVKEFAGFDAEIVNKLQEPKLSYDDYLHAIYLVEVAALFSKLGYTVKFLRRSNKDNQSDPDLEIKTGDKSAIVECKTKKAIEAEFYSNVSDRGEIASEILAIIEKDERNLKVVVLTIGKFNKSKELLLIAGIRDFYTKNRFNRICDIDGQLAFAIEANNGVGVTFAEINSNEFNSIKDSLDSADKQLKETEFGIVAVRINTQNLSHNETEIYTDWIKYSIGTLFPPDVYKSIAAVLLTGQPRYGINADNIQECLAPLLVVINPNHDNPDAFILPPENPIGMIKPSIPCAPGVRFDREYIMPDDYGIF